MNDGVGRLCSWVSMAVQYIYGEIFVRLFMPLHRPPINGLCLFHNSHSFELMLHYCTALNNVDSNLIELTKNFLFAFDLDQTFV